MVTRALGDDFLLRVFVTSADGLFPTSPRSIAQTGDGYVWMATSDGVVRFDGARAITYSGRNTPVLPVPTPVVLVHADRQDRLWCATVEGGLFWFDGHGWRKFGPAEGWEGMAVESIAEGPDGALLFAARQQLVRFADGAFRAEELPGESGGGQVLSQVFFDADGRLWATGPNAVWTREGGGWKTVLTGAVIQGAAPARGGGAWLATPGEIRKRGADGAETVFTRPLEFRNDRLQLLEDFRGNLWAGGSRTGLRVWMADSRAMAVDDSGGSSRAQIACLFEDRERNVLVGTRGAGLGCIRPHPFHVSLGSQGGLVGTMVNSVCEEAPGRILVGTDGAGLHRISRDAGDEMVAWSGDAMEADRQVTSLLRLGDGSVLAAFFGRGVFRLRGDQVEPLAARIPEGSTVRVLFGDSQGRIWIGHDRGAIVGGGAAFRAFPEGGAPFPGVRAIAEDSRGAVWMLGRSGLARTRGEGLDLVPLPGLATNANLLALHADREGSLWIGVENAGLARYRDGDVFLYTGIHGLPVSSIGAVVEEGGYLWLAGEKGLARVSRQSLDALARGGTGGLELQFFNHMDGFPSDAFRRGYQPTAITGSDGSIWFSTHKGALSVHPARLVTAAYEPPAVIEEVRAELALFPVTTANREDIRVPAGVRRLSIRCTSPWLGKPEQARFRYRLEGPNPVWQNFGTERLVRFNDLKPGRYRYSVWAVGTDGRLAEPAASIGLTILPAYWQTMWFRVLAAVGLVIAGAAVTWRIQQLRIVERDRKLRRQEERARLEEQLHQSQRLEAVGRLAGGIAHDFNNLLTVINGNAEILRLERAAGAACRHLVDAIISAGARARDLVGQILTFSRQHAVERSAVDLAPYLRDAVTLLRSGISATTDIRTRIPESLPPVLAAPSQIQRVLINLGTNAVQAVGAAGAHVDITVEPVAVEASDPELPAGRYVRMTVEDNGGGMDDDTLDRIFEPFYTTKALGRGTGLGLAVVHGIVAAHDGRIVVRSRVGDGTVFKVYLPVAASVSPSAARESGPMRMGGGERILLVDDEEPVLGVIRLMLERLAYRVDAHPDPDKAAAAFAAAPDSYGLVMTDLAMPRCNGIDLARRIWAARPGFPVILCTGFGGSIGPDAARELGFAFLLEKPFDSRAVSEAVADCLARARA